MNSTIDLAGLTVGAVVFLAPPEGGPIPSADDLVKLAPVASTSDASCRSIDFEALYRPSKEILLKYRLRYRAPDDLRIMLLDGLDDVPLIAASRREAIVYDAVRARVEHMTDPGIGLVFQFNDGGIRLGLGRDPDRVKPGEAIIDVKSIVDLPSTRMVSPEGERRFRLVCIPNGDENDRASRSVYHIDLGKKNPFAKMEFFSAAGDKAGMAVERLIVNGNIPANDLEFPSRRKIEAAFGTVGMVEASSVKSELLVGVFQSAFARFRARNPTAELELPAPSLLKGVDLEIVRMSDAKFAKRLKELFGEKSEGAVPAK